MISPHNTLFNLNQNTHTYYSFTKFFDKKSVILGTSLETNYF